MKKGRKVHKILVVTMMTTVNILYMDCICMCAMFSLGVGHCGVLDEGEVVGDVLVVRQPPMGPNQVVLTHRHLETEQTTEMSLSIACDSFFIFLSFFF